MFFRGQNTCSNTHSWGTFATHSWGIIGTHEWGMIDTHEWVVLPLFGGLPGANLPPGMGVYSFT